MAKRFTDTEKWADPWFRKLPPKIKLFWFYVTENCDPAGVWKVDLELASFMIGQSYKETEIFQGLGNRIERVGQGSDYWLIPQFCRFQYGITEFRDDFNPHKPILNSLRKHNIVSRVSQGLADPSNGRVLDKDKDMDMDKESLKDGGVGEGKKKRFQKPTPDEVSQYAKSISFILDGRKFVDYYESKGWLVGKSPMKDWKACVRTWKSNKYGGSNGNQRQGSLDIAGAGKYSD